MAFITVDVKNFEVFKKLVNLLKEIVEDKRIHTDVLQEYVDKLEKIIE